MTLPEPGQAASVQAVALSADGSRLATGSDDQTAKVWDTATGALLLEYTISSAVRHVALTADGSHLAIGDRSGRVGILATSPGAGLRMFEGYLAHSEAVPLSADGRLLALGATPTGQQHGIQDIALWDVNSGDLLRTVRIQGRNHLHSLALSGDGRLVAAGIDLGSGLGEGSKLEGVDQDFEYTAWVWDTASGALLHTLEGHTGILRTVVLSADGCLIATGSQDGTARLWDTATGALLRTLEYRACSAFSQYCPLALSANGSLLATASGEVAQIYDTATGARLHMPDDNKRHSQQVTSVALSADGRLLATGSVDTSAKLWSTVAAPKGTTRALLHTFGQPQGKK
eukprot:jgi/Tetstr1/442040/TSEL_030221.t1